MYRILIVDDEPEVVEGLEDILDDIDDIELEVHSAYSAADTLELLDHMIFDIVIADIKMPTMTGLEMYEIIKSKWPRCRVIFVSGVRDFDYVYKSIQNRNVHYLTKMEPDEKIIATVREVIQEIKNSYQMQNTLQLAEERFRQALPLLQNQYLYELLEGICPVEELCQSKLSELELPFCFEEPVLLVGAIFDNLTTLLPAEIKNRMRILKDICDTYCREYYHVVCFITEQNLLICLLQPHASLSQNNFKAVLNATLENLQNACRETIHETITLAYSEMLLPIEQISDQYKNLKQTLGYKQGIVSEAIIITNDYVDVPIYENETPINASKQLTRMNILDGYLELGQEKDFFLLLEEITNCLREVKSKNYTPALEIYYRISAMFLKYINQWVLAQQIAFHIDLHRLTHLAEHNTWNDAVEYLHLLANTIFSLHFSEEENRYQDAVTTVKCYILENLEKDLTLVFLADMVKLNPTYLSRLFKEVTSMNLYGYILELRMTQAMKLLKKTNDKVHDIALAVGYESSQSFARTFKKFAGIPPLEYRNEVIVSN